MGFVKDIFDTNKGSGFSGHAAEIKPGVTDAQLAESYKRTNKGLGSQWDFMRALQQQGGIQNQANVFAQQQALADMLNQQAQGGGPNPALAQLAQTTGQNVAQQAALMAGQRGMSVNPGLAARQIAAQGLAANQQAGGQAAIMRANQQLAAQQALQNQQQNMAGLAGQQVGQQAGATNAYGNAAQNQFGALQGALAAQNQANVGMQSNINNANAGIAGINAKGQQGLFGGAMNSVGSVIGGLAHGGVVGCYADGGQVTDVPADKFGPESFLGSMLNKPQEPEQNPAEDPLFLGSSNLLGGALKKVGSLVSSAAPAASSASAIVPALVASGGKVPGKAPVAGDSYANDKVPAMLSPGEVVIPRTAVKDPNSTAEFLNALLGYNLKAKGKK